MSERMGNVVMAAAYGMFLLACWLTVMFVDTGSDQGDTIVQIAAVIFAVLPAIEWSHLQRCKREREQQHRLRDYFPERGTTLTQPERCDLCAEPNPTVRCDTHKLNVCRDCYFRHTVPACRQWTVLPLAAETEARSV